jgi:hypothetical protein
MGDAGKPHDRHGAPDSTLGLPLKAAPASGELVVVDTGERRYTLVVSMTEPAPDIFADDDPQAAIAGLRALEDALSSVDRERLLRDLRAERAQNSQGSVHRLP